MTLTVITANQKCLLTLCDEVVNPTKMELRVEADTANAAKISSIRSAIDGKLHADGVYDKIRRLILSKASSKADKADQDEGDDLRKTEDELIKEVLQSELVQQLLNAIKHDRELKKDADTGCDEEDVENTGTMSPEPCLFVRLAGGRAFVDQLTQEDTNDEDAFTSITAHQIGQVRQFFRVVVNFQGQRLSSTDVACSVDPAFNETFRLAITKRKTRSGRTKSGGLYEIEVVAPWEALCLVDEPVEIVLLKITKKIVGFQHSTGALWHELKRDLVATHRLDWRRVLCSTLQLVHTPIQLLDKMKVPVGTLDVRLDLLHFTRTASIAKDVTAFLNKEALERNTLSHAFYRHAKEWWHEYRSEMDALETNVRRSEELQHDQDPSGFEDPRLTPQTRSRLVKLFAEDDEGKFRMVSKFVSPIRAPLAVRSPSEAARFVSLIPLDTAANIGGVVDEAWRSISTMLTVGKGDVQDHAVLLASLLLGCGLDAYVCIGTVSSRKRLLRDLDAQRRRRQGTGGPGSSSSAEAGHVWVMTRDPERPTDPAGVLFWESINGDRYSVCERVNGTVTSSAVRHGYVSLDCVFSPTRFYASLQPRQWKISDYSFDLDDDTAWKALDPRRIADLPSCVTLVTITSPDFGAVISREQQWMASFKRQISSQRRAQGLTTKWVDELALYLQPALNSYEMERLHHVPQLENDLFQQTIKRFVKEGYTFQAVPMMFKSGLAEDAVETLLENDIAATIVVIQGRAAQFGLAVRCFAYPEDLFVIWVMLAVSYQT